MATANATHVPAARHAGRTNHLVYLQWFMGARWLAGQGFPGPVVRDPDVPSGFGSIRTVIRRDTQ